MKENLSDNSNFDAGSNSPVIGVGGSIIPGDVTSPGSR
jgi:hypothetical protein